MNKITELEETASPETKTDFSQAALYVDGFQTLLRTVTLYISNTKRATHALYTVVSNIRIWHRNISELTR